MKNTIRVLSAAALVASAASVSLAATTWPEAAATVFTPGKGLVQQIGDVHAIAYFEPGKGTCGLTIVLASSKTGAAEDEAHGTRISVPVPSGMSMTIDGTNKQSAEYMCGHKGLKMSTHIYDRETYKRPKS